MDKKLRICGLISGGKDSNYAFYHALVNGHIPVCILAIRPAREDSWMFHVPFTSLVKYQAKAMGLEDIYYEFEVSGLKEREVEELEKILYYLKKKVSFDIISVGAIASQYQYKRINRISRKLGVKVYSPHWKMDPKQYMRQLVIEGFKFVIIKISVYGLSPEYLGKIIQISDINNIINLAEKYGFNPAFEGGEAETFVVDAPHFKKYIRIQGRKKKLGPEEWQFDINEIKLVDKGKN